MRRKIITPKTVHGIQLGLFFGLAMNCVSANAATETCQCPILETAHLKELYGTGETYDYFRGYVPHTKRKVTKKSRGQIELAKLFQAFKSKDGTCTCWYSVRDSNGRELDELGLEELQPKLSGKEVS